MLADLLLKNHPKVRQAIYAVLATAYALEAIWDIVADELEGRLLTSLGVLGFALAAGNVGSSKD